MSEGKYLIDDRVIFDYERMTLTRAEETVTLSESERNLLIAFYQGLFKKEELMGWVWGRKGVVVSDASYYKLINQLRNTFDKIGLSPSALVTRPKVGVELTLSMTPIATPASAQTPSEEAQSLATESGETPTLARQHALRAPAVKDWLCFALAALLMLSGIYASLRDRHAYFSAPIAYEGYQFYKVSDDKTSFADVKDAFAEVSSPLFKQNGRHIYYIRVPDTHIFVQCLNQLSVAEPKCITLKERY